MASHNYHPLEMWLGQVMYLTMLRSNLRRRSYMYLISGLFMLSSWIGRGMD